MEAVYSPSNQVLLFQYKTSDGQVITERLGFAVNMFINTVRGKMPIFVFGKDMPVATARGSGFIYGSIDELILDEDQFYHVMQNQPVTINAKAGKLFGYDVNIEELIGNSVEEGYYPDIDTIKLDKIIVVAQQPAPTDVAQNGSSVEYIELELHNVEFFGYSYQKRVTDVTQLMRVNFLAERMKVASNYYAIGSTSQPSGGTQV